MFFSHLYYQFTLGYTHPLLIHKCPVSISSWPPASMTSFQGRSTGAPKPQSWSYAGLSAPARLPAPNLPWAPPDENVVEEGPSRLHRHEVRPGSLGCLGGRKGIRGNCGKKKICKIWINLGRWSCQSNWILMILEANFWKYWLGILHWSPSEIIGPLELQERWHASARGLHLRHGSCHVKSAGLMGNFAWR